MGSASSGSDRKWKVFSGDSRGHGRGPNYETRSKAIILADFDDAFGGLEIRTVNGGIEVRSLESTLVIEPVITNVVRISRREL